MIKRLVSGILVICFLITSVSASTLYVGGSGGYKTIQSAVDNATEEDTIIVNSGTYPEYVNLSESANGLTILGKDYPKVNGFFDSGPTDIFVTNLNINGFSIVKNGIHIGGRGSDNNIIKNNYFYSCGASIDGDYGDNNSIKNNQFANGGISIGAAAVTIVGNTVKNTDIGIYLGSGAGGEAFASEISGNTITGCNIGINFKLGRAGDVYNNNFNNKINIKNVSSYPGEKLANNWNISPIKDYNILLGPYIAGNFWGSPNGKGFSQTAPDNDHDGLADYPYVIEGNNIDYKPLVAIKTPVASFTASPISGTAPLNVAFTDTSIGSPTSWSWNFGDGTTSNLQNPTNTYSSVGSYTVTLTVSDANGITSSKTTTIDVLEQSSSNGGGDNGGDNSGDSSGSGSDGSSSGGSSGSSSSSGGGGAGGSPEHQENVETKELSQTFVGSGQSVKFDFPQKATPVVSVSFDSKKTVGKITTIAEMLKAKSTLVSGLPSDEVYKSLNIWVGNSGFATSKNIENAVICFKVEKSWVQDKNIDPATIALNRYTDNKWDQLQTSKSGEDESYLYFAAKTQGFSEFAITGKTKAKETVTELQSKTEIKDIGQNKLASDVKQANEQKGKISAPGFEIVYGIIGLLGIFLCRRRSY